MLHAVESVQIVPGAVHEQPQSRVEVPDVLRHRLPDFRVGRDDLHRGVHVENRYLDAVEETLCFGWIDSTFRIIDGRRMQRFSPRRRNGNRTELNRERVRRLEKLGLMTDPGRAVVPVDNVFVVDAETESVLKGAGVWSELESSHALYQRIRASRPKLYREHHTPSYDRMLKHPIEETAKGRMYGSRNGYGRLLDY